MIVDAFASSVVSIDWRTCRAHTCVISDRSFDELVYELSCIGKAISALSGPLIVMTGVVLIIDSHVGDAAAVRQVTATRLIFTCNATLFWHWSNIRVFRCGTASSVVCCRARWRSTHLCCQSNDN